MEKYAPLIISLVVAAIAFLSLLLSSKSNQDFPFGGEETRD